METKYLVGVLVLIVAIGGATACNFLLPPSSNPVQDNAASTVSSPVAVNDSGNSQQTQQTNTRKQ